MGQVSSKNRGSKGKAAGIAFKDPIMLKTLVGLILVFYVFGIWLKAQQVIENPSKPLSKNAGRVLGLKEILRIKDQGGQFYFRTSPGGFSAMGIDTDGFIYIKNDKDQILKFDPRGEFLKNIIRAGQGPGEVSPYFKFIIAGKEVFVLDFDQNRIIRLSTEGELIHQWTTRSSYDDFLGITNNYLVFSRAKYPPLEERKGKLVEIPYEVILVPKDGSEERLIFTFSVLRFLAPDGAATWAPFHAALSDDGRLLFVNHTAEYEITVLELETAKIVRKFKRKYPRVKYASRSPGERQFFRKYNFKRPYEADIAGLHVFNDRLWVKTSKKDKEKGSLFDVFSFDGAYLDAFFIPKNMVAVRNGRLFIWETDPEGYLSLLICSVDK